MRKSDKPEENYRALPFWALNGKLDREELLDQVACFAQMGMGGAFLHARTGLETEYLSAEWMADLGTCAEAFASHGMRAWLYDEDRWPSGTCGGLVTRDPRRQMKFLRLDLFERGAGQGPLDAQRTAARQKSGCDCDINGGNGKGCTDCDAGCGGFFEAFAVRLDDAWDGRAPVGVEDFFAVSEWEEVPAGYLAAVFTIRPMGKSDFYNGNTYLDTMSREATEAFLASTHEAYRRALGAHFGREIAGIFTDEPHRGALFNGFGAELAEGWRYVPYTPELLDAYAARWGERLEECLPLLWFRAGKRNFSRTAWRFVEVLQELFLNHFARPYRDWCQRGGLLWTGHVLHEDSLASQTTMSGSVMRFYEYMDIPGIDYLGSAGLPFWVPKQAASVAKQCGKPFVLSELYGATGWKTTFADYKYIGDWQAALGVNLRCPHLAFYTMKGEAKRDYPASIFRQSNWYREFSYVEDYFARLGKLLSEGAPATELIVVSPVESAWGLSHSGTYDEAFGVRDPEYRTLEEMYAETARRLLGAQIDFDYADEEMLSRLGRVQGEGAGAALAVGRMKYRVLLLSGLVTVRASTLRLAEDFARVGGRVVVCGCPAYLDGEPAAFPVEKFQTAKLADLPAVLADCRGLPMRLCEFEATVMGAAKESEVTGSAGGAEPHFLATVRRCGGDDLLFLLHLDRTEARRAQVRVRGDRRAERLDVRTGERRGIAFDREGEETVIDYDFAPGEELLLRLTDEEVLSVERPLLGAPAALADRFRYALDEDNALVLDWAEVRLNGVSLGEDEILRIDRAVRARMGLAQRGGEAVQPWFREKYGAPVARGDQYRLELRFAFDVEVVPERLALRCEMPEAFSFRLNGAPLAVTGRRRSALDCCFSELDLDPGQLRTGRNILESICSFDERIDLEALCLLGPFGVRSGRPHALVALPETLACGDLGEQGLPFYTGSVHYLAEVPPGRYRVRFGRFGAACLSANGRIAAFAPYELEEVPVPEGVLDLTAHLTRRNLFGPLHEAPEGEVCGPENFRAEGERFSADVRLIAQGLFEKPQVRPILR